MNTYFSQRISTKWPCIFMLSLVCSALSSIVSASLLMRYSPKLASHTNHILFQTHKPFSFCIFHKIYKQICFPSKHKCSLCHIKSKVTWLVEWFRIIVRQSDLSAAVQFRPWRWSSHSSKTSLTTSKLTSHHIPEDLNCHTNHCLTPVTGARNFNILNDTSL